MNYAHTYVILEVSIKYRHIRPKATVGGVLVGCAKTVVNS